MKRGKGGAMAAIDVIKKMPIVRAILKGAFCPLSVI